MEHTNVYACEMDNYVNLLAMQYTTTTGHSCISSKLHAGYS